MALFKNYLTCYCMMLILNHAERSFIALKLKKNTDLCCVKLSHQFIHSHQIHESLENAMFYITGC
jgi:hypothetical protein